MEYVEASLFLLAGPLILKLNNFLVKSCFQITPSYSINYIIFISLQKTSLYPNMSLVKIGLFKW